MSRFSTIPCETSEVLAVAKKAVAVLRRYGLDCCLMGSVACYLYGTTRRPNDVDLIVMTSLYDQESLKRLLVAADGSFYLVDSKNRLATYKVLWCRVGLRRCKVDILRPVITLNIPDIPPSDVVHSGGLPVIPLVPLVLLKLQGWMDHRDSKKPWERRKESVDIADVKAILTIACQRGVKVDRDMRNRLPLEFVRTAERRVRQFVMKCPETRASWIAFGLFSEDTLVEALSALRM